MKRKFVFQWHITHKCNLRCKHCYQEEYCEDLELAKLTDFFNQICDYIQAHDYWGHINFTGGEPFVSNHLWSLFDLCENNNITFGILTNGTLINPEIADRLAGYRNLRFVQISIDGSREVHDTIRGAGNFDKAFATISLLKRAGIQTMVSFTASRTNKDELKKVIRICEKAGVDRFWTDRLVPMGNNTLDCMTTQEYGAYLKVLGKESRRAERLPWIRTRIHTNRALQFLCNCKEGGYMCSAGKNLLTILADGTLLPCRRLPLELGNLLEDNVDSIMQNSDILAVLRQDNMTEECKKCRFKARCNGGAKCLTYAITGKWNGKDVNCPM